MAHLGDILSQDLQLLPAINAFLPPTPAARSTFVKPDADHFHVLTLCARPSYRPLLCSA